MKCFRIRRWFSNALVGLFSIRLLISFAAIVAASILLSSCAGPGPLIEGMRPTIKSVTIWPTTDSGNPIWHGNSHLIFWTNLCSECSGKLMITPRDEFDPEEPSQPLLMAIGGAPDYDTRSGWDPPGSTLVLDGSRIVYEEHNDSVIQIITSDKDGSNELILRDGIIIEDPKYFWFGMSINMHGTTLVYTVSNKNEALLGEIDLRSGRHATLFKTNEKVGIEPTHPSFIILDGDPQKVIPRGYTASPALNDPGYNKDGSKISYFRSIMGASSWNPMFNMLEYEWKTRQLFVYSKATGKIRQVTPDDSVILDSDWNGDELYFIGSIGSQSGLWQTDESGQIKQLLSFVCNKKPRSVEVPPNGKRIAFCNNISGSVEFSPNGKYIVFSTRDSGGGMVGIAHIK